MKCPKCNYLGFETGDRCKNCGYDFSLITDGAAERIEIDLDLHETESNHRTAVDWLTQLYVPGTPSPTSTPQERTPAEPSYSEAALSEPAFPEPELPEPFQEPTWPEPASQEWELSEPIFQEPELSEPVFQEPDLSEPAFPEPTFPSVASAQTAAQFDRPPPPEPPATPMAANTSAESRLPLFRPPTADDSDEPLVRLPATPRPPLAVRRTPDAARLRAYETAARLVERDTPPDLEFNDNGEGESKSARQPVSRIWREIDRPRRGLALELDPSPPGARLGAAAIDHVILAGIDLAVLYFTIRMAGLSMGNWTMLPAAPLATFLLVIKLAYFWAFTVVGGQTIGKMAMHIRVVTADEEGPLDAAHAVRRTLAAALSAALLGLGFLPALIGPDRRALHDRIARTRVVVLPSA